MTRAIRALASAVLAAALVSGATGAQTPESEPVMSKAKPTEAVTGEPAPVTPTPAEPSPAKPSKKASKPFKPTERIEAESVVSFPANI